MVLSVFILGLFPFVLRFEKSNKRKVVRLLRQMLISYRDFLLLVHQNACLLNYFFFIPQKNTCITKIRNRIYNFYTAPIMRFSHTMVYFFLPGYFFFLFWMLFRNLKVKMFVWIMLNNCCLLLIRVLFPLTGFLYNIFGVL